MNEFDEFLDSVKEKPRVLMYHSPSDIRVAQLFFGELFADYELQFTQTAGRFWDFGTDYLYILLDNEMVLCADLNIISGKKISVEFRESVKSDFPDSLRGRYYNE